RFLHAQKQSVALDVSTATGRELLGRLLGTADVLIDDGALGSPPDVAAVYDDLMAENPELVVAAFSPYGLEGPRAGWTSSELTEMAAACWLPVGPHGGLPIIPGTPCGRYGAGIF